MKTFGIISLIVILVLAAFFLGKCHKENQDYRQRDTVYLSPDTIIKTDTIYPRIVYKYLCRYYPGDTVFVPVEINDTSYSYIDSIWDDQVKIKIDDVITNKGYLIGRQVGYQLFVPKEIKTTEYITQEIQIRPKLTYYGMAGLGLDTKKLIFSGEIGIKKNKNMYGVQYLRLDGKGALMLKYGINF